VVQHSLPFKALLQCEEWLSRRAWSCAMQRVALQVCMVLCNAKSGSPGVHGLVQCKEWLSRCAWSCAMQRSCLVALSKERLSQTISGCAQPAPLPKLHSPDGHAHCSQASMASLTQVAGMDTTISS